MKKLPIPTGSRILIEPHYDPDKIGSIFMPPQAQNLAPSSGKVVATGPSQTEVEVGYLVLVSYARFDSKKLWHDEDRTEYAFYDDDEVVAFLAPDAEVFPRKGCVIVRPSWDISGVVERNKVAVIQRVFDSPPPRFGTVLRTAEGVTTVKRGDTVILPKSGGHELGVRDRVLYSIRETDLMGILTNAVKNDKDRRDSSRG
jgi:co-chaperonin GroES (HSP10)